MLAAGDEFQHRSVHLNEASIGKRIFLLALNHRLLNLRLKEIRLDCVDHLHRTPISPEEDPRGGTDG